MSGGAGQQAANPALVSTLSILGKGLGLCDATKVTGVQLDPNGRRLLGGLGECAQAVFELWTHSHILPLGLARGLTYA